MIAANFEAIQEQLVKAQGQLMVANVFMASVLRTSTNKQAILDDMESFLDSDEWSKLGSHYKGMPPKMLQHFIDLHRKE